MSEAGAFFAPPLAAIGAGSVLVVVAVLAGDPVVGTGFGVAGPVLQIVGIAWGVVRYLRWTDGQA